MIEAERWHQQAMEYVSLAEIASVKGDQNESKLNLEKALEYELKSAEYYRDKLELEPTRGILYNSAANISFGLANYSLAARLALQCLKGSVSEDIKRDCIILLEQIPQSTVEAEIYNENRANQQRKSTDDSLFENSLSKGIPTILNVLDYSLLAYSFERKKRLIQKRKSMQ